MARNMTAEKLDGRSKLGEISISKSVEKNGDVEYEI